MRLLSSLVLSLSSLSPRCCPAPSPLLLLVSPDKQSLGVVAVIVSSSPRCCGCRAVGELGPPVVPVCIGVPASIVVVVVVPRSIVVIVAVPSLSLFCLLLVAAHVHPASSRSWRRYLVIPSLSSFCRCLLSSHRLSTLRAVARSSSRECWVMPTVPLLSPEMS